MKNCLAFALCALLVVLSVGSNAQDRVPPPKEENPAESVSRVVKDLSIRQKRQIDAIADEYGDNIKAMRAQLCVKRDSIHFYMSQKADYSAVMMPLMDREAALQAHINKEMYRMKVELDAVLTPQQYAPIMQKNLKMGPPKEARRAPKDTMHRSKNAQKQGAQKKTK